MSVLRLPCENEDARDKMSRDETSRDETARRSMSMSCLSSSRAMQGEGGQRAPSVCASREDESSAQRREWAARSGVVVDAYGCVKDGECLGMCMLG